MIVPPATMLGPDGNNPIVDPSGFLFTFLQPKATFQVPDDKLSLFPDASGNIDLVASFRADGSTITGKLWEASSSSGEVSMRRESNEWKLKVNGSDVSPGAPMYDGAALEGHLVTVETLFRGVTGAPNGQRTIRWRVNGCELYDEGYAANSNATIVAPSEMWFGRSVGGTLFAGGMLDFEIHGVRPAPAYAPSPVEFAMFGDSLFQYAAPDAYHGGYPMVGSLVYAGNEAKTRAGIKNYGYAGSNIASQNNIWTVVAKDIASLKVAVIRAGINDVAGLRTFAQIKADLQAMIDDINTDRPDVEIILKTLTPAKGLWDVLGNNTYDVWQAVNESIMGEGSDPITGDNLHPEDWTRAQLDNGSGYLKTQYAAPDGSAGGYDFVHTNLPGRQKDGEGTRAALVAIGKLP